VAVKLILKNIWILPLLKVQRLGANE